MLLSERTIELTQHLEAEARGKWCARQIDDIADALQADSAEAGNSCRRKPKRSQRQRIEQRAFFATSVTFRLSIMRSGPCGADCAGNGKRIGKAGIFQTAAEIGNEFMLAAIKMRAAADVEQQAVRCIASHQRRVAQAPVGN